MTVLVLNHRPLSMRPIGRWIGDAGPLVMVTTRAARAGSPQQEAACFERIITVDDYQSAEVERAARTLADRYRPGRIASSNEYDLVRAAVLRERYGLAGQPLAGALAYRDKLVMRQAAAAAGLTVPAFTGVRSPARARAFADAWGMPVVVKPRRGAGGGGITIVRREQDLRPAVELAGRGPGGVLVEQYIEGILCHIDGLSVEGKVVHCWPSRYDSGVLEALARGGPRMGVLLDAGDPWRSRLQDFAARVIAALPVGGAFAFHIEAWIRDGQDAPVLCEVTSRASGGPVVAAYERAFGVNLFQESFLVQAGLPPILAHQPQQPDRYVSWVNFLTRPGVFAAPGPGRPPVASFTALIPDGYRGGPARLVSDTAAEAVVDGATSQQALARRAELLHWWEASRPWR